MKLKPLLSTVALLAVSTAAVWWFMQPDSQEEKTDSLVGQKLLSPSLVEKADRIVLSKPAERQTVILHKEEDGTWTLPEYHNLPADFAKLQRLIQSLLNATILRFVTNNPERLERLDLGSNRIVLKAGEENTLWSLETGKQASSDGLFVRLNNEGEAYLADLNLFLDTNQESWTEKKLLSFEAKDVAALTIEFIDEDTSLELSRDSSEGSFTSKALPESQKVKESEVTRFLNTLINARFTKVSKPDDSEAMAAQSNARTIKLKLFNSDTYTLRIGRRPSEPVEKKSPPEDTEEEKPEITDPGPVFIFFESSNSEDRLNKIMEKIALQYSDYTYNQVSVSRDKLIETVVKTEDITEVTNEGPKER